MNVKPYQPLVKLPSERANILLVDDRPENLLALEAVLDDLGTNFVKANSGEEALRRLLENEFAIVLLDIQMQGMDGFETARLIRTRAKNRHTPIIFLTAYDTEPDQLEKGYSLGAVDFLTKPFIPYILRAKLAALVQLSEERLQATRLAEQYQLLIEGTAEYAIFMLDPEGRVLTWNGGARRLKGYAAEEIIGQHFSRFYTKEAVESGWPGHELTVAKTEGRIEDEGWRLRKDGSRFWANVVITALRDPTGDLIGFSKITRDLTERRQAEENARHLLQEEASLAAAEADPPWRLSEPRAKNVANGNNCRSPFQASVTA